MLCVMVYSVSMPLIFVMAFLFYFLFFWVYKTLLLKFYRRTVSFNEDLPMSTIKWIKFSLVVHGLTSIFLISDMNLMPLSDPFDDFNEWQINHSGNWLRAIRIRIQYRFYCQIFLGVYLLLVLYFIAQDTFFKCLAYLCIPCKKCCCQDKKVAVLPHEDCMEDEFKEKEGESNDFFSEIHVDPLSQYFDRLALHEEKF